MRRVSRVLRGVQLVCAIAAAFPSAGVAAPLDDLADNQTRFGKITGDVELLSQGSLDWIAATEGLPIETGDLIRTGAESYAELVVGHHSVWVLLPDSELIPERIDEKGGRLNLPLGALLGTVDEKRETRSLQWVFNTPFAVCTVRETQFALETSRDTGTRLTVFSGHAELQPAEGPGGLEEPVRISAKEEALVERGRPIRHLRTYTDKGKVRWAQRPDLQSRLRRNQGIWSPHTPALRKELRAKFIKPVAKKKPAVPKVRQRRGSKVPPSTPP